MSRANALLKAVIDTNLFVGGTISERGAAFQLLEFWRAGTFRLLISSDQVAELEDVLSRERIAQRYNITPERRAALFQMIDTTAKRVRPRRRLPVSVRDPKDEKILAAALAGRADYLVTGDEDLLELRHDPRLGTLQIVTVGEFLAQLRMRQTE